MVDLGCEGLFGGGLLSIICRLGHHKITLRNAYKALSSKIIESDLDMKFAERLAKRWFVANSQEFYPL